MRALVEVGIVALVMLSAGCISTKGERDMQWEINILGNTIKATTHFKGQYTVPERGTDEQPNAGPTS